MDLITRYFLLWIILIGDPSNSEASVCGDNFEHPGTCLISDYGRSDVFLLKSIIKYARHDYVNTKCFSHIMHMWSGIENSELWAIKGRLSGQHVGIIKEFGLFENSVQLWMHLETTREALLPEIANG